jgi:hypothetical protein
MAARSRKVYRLNAVGVALSLTEVLPFNATLLQLTAKFDSSPTETEDLVAIKVSGVNAAYDIVFGTLDIASIGSPPDPLNLFCDDRVEFLKGDSIQITYPNTDTVNIGLEVIFKEAD